MASAQEQYTREIHDGLQYFATWLPITTVEVGDIGLIKNGAFQKRDTLEARKVAFATTKARPVGSLQYSSARGVAVKVNLAGSGGPLGTPLGKASVEVSFTSKNAVLFDAANCSSEAITNIADVSEAILRLYNQGNWDEKLMVVSEIVRAGSATILISRTRNASTTLSASTTGPIKSLADASAGFEMTSSEDLAVKIVAQTDLTPLFRLLRVNTGFLGFGETVVTQAKSIKKNAAGARKPRARPRGVGPVGINELFSKKR